MIARMAEALDTRAQGGCATSQVAATAEPAATSPLKAHTKVWAIHHKRELVTMRHRKHVRLHRVLPFGVRDCTLTREMMPCTSFLGCITVLLASNAKQSASQPHQG
jgi:hypothetical protein